MSNDEEVNETLRVGVPAELTGERLDKTLAALCDGFSRSRLQALIEGGDVTVNGNVCTGSKFPVSAGDVIKITVPPLLDAIPKAENLPLDIVYQDDDLLVINKAVGMTVHPGAGQHSGTLVNALLYHCAGDLSGIGGVARPGIVHRLDKDTSGLMVVAKNDRAHKGLSDQLVDRSLSRIYTAFVWKVPMPIKGVIDIPIGRHKTSRIKMTVHGAAPRDAVTHYHVAEAYGKTASKVICQLESGRTHQIRVHMTHLKHPLIGDALYGLPDQEARSLLNRGGLDEMAREAVMAMNRQALHAGKIGFIHPTTGEEMAFEAPMPQDLLDLETLLETVG
jgi:23S rRNA pseudouridine1911/1915/1917 synthase